MTGEHGAIPLCDGRAKLESVPLLGEPQRGERAGAAVYSLITSGAWAGGENLKPGLERRPRRTAIGSQPEHQDQPRLFPSPSG